MTDAYRGLCVIFCWLASVLISRLSGFLPFSWPFSGTRSFSASRLLSAWFPLRFAQKWNYPSWFVKTSIAGDGRLIQHTFNSFAHQWFCSPLLGPGFFSFVFSFYTDGRTPWTSHQRAATPLPPRRTTQTQNKRAQTSMPWVGFEPTIPAFELAKTIHAVDRAATVIITSYTYIF
jgi:hypothetical protein